VKISADILTLWIGLFSNDVIVNALVSSNRRSHQSSQNIVDPAIRQNIPVVVKAKSRRQQHTAASPSALWKQLAAGGVSRSLAQMVLYPIDAVRTLKQPRDGRTLRDVGVSALLHQSLPILCDQSNLASLRVVETSWA
jgi:hypothetical protein